MHGPRLRQKVLYGRLEDELLQLQSEGHEDALLVPLAAFRPSVATDTLLALLLFLFGFSDLRLFPYCVVHQVASIVAIAALGFVTGTFDALVHRSSIFFTTLLYLPFRYLAFETFLPFMSNYPSLDPDRGLFLPQEPWQAALTGVYALAVIVALTVTAVWTSNTPLLSLVTLLAFSAGLCLSSVAAIVALGSGANGTLYHVLQGTAGVANILCGFLILYDAAAANTAAVFRREVLPLGRYRTHRFVNATHAVGRVAMHPILFVRRRPFPPMPARPSFSAKTVFTLWDVPLGRGSADDRVVSRNAAAL
jgi:hypothetical protein